MYQQPPPTVKKNNNVLWIVLAVLAVCGCGGVVILGAILFPVFQSAKVAAKQGLAFTNIKRSALAQIMYSTDYDDRLPPANRWMDVSLPYAKTEDIFKSPAVSGDDSGAFGFAFRKQLSGIESASILSPGDTAMVFDSTVISRNASAELDTLPSPPRYGNVNMIAFADGHGSSMNEEDAKKLESTVKFTKQ